MRSGLPVGDLPHRDAFTVDLPTPAVALAVGAHPDDIELGCGATLAKWAARGCRISHLVLTDGSKGTWSDRQDEGELVSTRQKEQIEAAAILGGGDVTFLGWVDGELGHGTEQRRDVCRAIRRVRPDVVLGHDPWRRYRLHPDHRSAGWLTTDGVVAARDPKFFPEIEEPPHRPSSILLWEADEPNHVEQAIEFIDVKCRALLAHRSQHLSTFGITEGSDTDGSRSLLDKVAKQMAAHGEIAGVGAGEAFRLIDDL